VAALVVAIALALSTGTRAEVTATHDTVISFDSKVFPKVLPRSGTAPVGIRIEGHLKARSKREPAPLTKLELAIERAGQLSARGLPVCDIARIDPASSAQALELCGDAQIGHGRVKARLTFPGQPHLAINARVIVFNGRLQDGSRAILLHAFNAVPPVSYVFPLRIAHRPGRYGTALTANVSLNRWSRITDFRLVLFRTYRYKGKERSLLSAGCPAPEGFTVGVSRFVQATLYFGDGKKSRIPVVGSCKVAS
jgi:hypothetical protein